VIPVKNIETELNLVDAAVSLNTTLPVPEPLDVTYTSERHLFAMNLSTITPAEGRYFEMGDRPEFSPVGSVFFRPAKLHLNVRGQQPSGRPGRAVHCTLDDRRLQALNVAGVTWTEQTLQATLDIWAGHLRSYFVRMMAELQQPSFASPVIVDAVLTLMVSELLEYLAPQYAKHQASFLAGNGMVRTIRERVCDLHTITPTVAELSELCGVSDRHLLRLFREREGMSLIEFIRQARLQKAMELLAGSPLRLKEIAYRLGFQSHASFTTAFGRETGMSPARYRRAHRRTYIATRH